MNHAFLLSSALLAFTACASAPLAQDRLTSLAAAIQSADEVGAGKYPQAALHLRLAQEELDEARQLAKEGESARAELFLQRSAADAELALILTREAEAHVDAAHAQAAVNTLEGT